MLQLCIIKELFTAQSRPVIMVPKPDRSCQFCNNFRSLNKVSEFDSSPMSRVDELIEGARTRPLPLPPGPHQGISAGPPDQSWEKLAF